VWLLLLLLLLQWGRLLKQPLTPALRAGDPQGLCRILRQLAHYLAVIILLRQPGHQLLALISLSNSLPQPLFFR
jgi:hypothetical protein